ncbi:glucose-6-phosphate isomerase [Rhizoctonia solani]|uniref:Glucose-6-phosphate isomerase n=1 Tax=Rhizoctonia solani TaxID=456999 RepID=A0A8H8STJ0_9AGAM|nr:glucose-6-phosphate isomerase [Rhizoctonia solani]QRW17144.1 glucose-6-phosphate isomerase [Rhizoctonia solani]
MSLPSIASILNSNDTSRTSPLAQALATLFEPSEILYTKVVPNLSLGPSTTYTSLIDSATILILSLPLADQAHFVAGHPRIGEVSNLSALSAAEQAKHATPPEVLERLKELNEAYEKRYPGLVYITFVNGRTRADIVPEWKRLLQETRWKLAERIGGRSCKGL